MVPSMDHVSRGPSWPTVPCPAAVAPTDTHDTRGTSMLAPDPQPHPDEGLLGQGWGLGDRNLFGFMII